MASEIDLAWTYVGAPTGLIGQFLADARIETLPATDWKEQNIPICMGQCMIVIKQEPIQNGYRVA